MAVQVTVAQLTETLRALDLTGVLANAMLGGAIARAVRLDPVGVATLAIISGLGGGIIRDVLLQAGPPVALTDYAYVLTALAGAGVAFVVPIGGRVWDRAWPLVDALAVGCWAAAGAQKTLGFGFGWLPAVLLGTVTAVGGGFVRDVVLRRIPGILGGNTLYATCALTASAVMVLFFRSHHPNVGSIVATLVGAGLVLLARWRRWVLPQNDDWTAVGAARTGYDRGVQYLRAFASHGDVSRHRRETSDARDPDTDDSDPNESEHSG